MVSQYAKQVFKCLPIYEKFGKDSYQKYLFKLIIRMLNDKANLTLSEQRVVEALKGLREANEFAEHDEVRSVILNCSAMLYENK